MAAVTFIVGLFVGAFIGVVISSLCAAAGRGDSDEAS
jgi:hypothetical protein